MENEKSYSIPIGGITRNTSFLNSPDGELAEAINIRNKYGKAYPVYQIEERPVLEGLDILYIHKTAQYENIIVYEAGGICAYTISPDGNGDETKSGIITVIPEIGKDGINAISHIGNILIISSETKMFFYIYESTKYSSIDIPDKLNIYAFAKDYTQLDAIDTALSDPSVLYHPLKVGGYDDKYRVVYAQNTHYYKSISSYEERPAVNELFTRAREDGHLYNPVLFRAAITLYDGRHISVSDPVLVMGSAGTKVAAYKNRPLSVSILPYDIYFYIFDALFNIPNSIVAGITLFIAEIDPYKDRNINSAEILSGDWVIADIDSFAQLVVLDGSENHPIKQYDDGFIAHTAYHYEKDIFCKRVKEVSVYRKAAFVPLDDIQYGFLENRLQIENLDNIENAESLEISDGIEFHGASAYKYNEQIHIWNYKTFLPDINPLGTVLLGVNASMFDTSFGFASSPGVVSEYTLSETFAIIKYKDAYGKERTRKSRKIDYFNPPVIGVNPFFAYNATSATMATVYYKFSVNGEDRYYSISFNVSESPFDNISYSLRETLSIYPDAINQNLYDSAWDDSEDDAFYESSSNKLRVSETSNPFIFPVEKTYTLGGGDILGLAVATQPISQGQFGLYPLYAFCSDGIWALQTGGADTSYSVQSPVSFDVCNNPESITPVLDGIIFSTQNGLKILSGNHATKISASLDGETTKAANNPYLENDMALAGFDTAISDDILFKNYLANAGIVYNYPEDELIIYNPSYPYSYCYGGGLWTKRSGCIRGAVTDYPGVYLDKGESGAPRWFNITRETPETLPLFFLTRPCKIGSASYKRITRSIFRSYIDGATTSLLLLGSNDGKNFVPVNKVVSNAIQRTDIHLGRGIKPYKYYAFAFTLYPIGDTRFELTNIDISFFEIYTKKIR